MMSRRIFAALAPKAGILRMASARTGTGKAKVVYHLDEAAKVDVVLSSIRNHYAGTMDQGIAIVIVVHGPALRRFREESAGIEVASALADLRDLGLEARACVNTLRAEGIGVADLLPGFAVAARGGVVELAALQHEGFAYIRP